jgi:hypothetical protein
MGEVNKHQMGVYVLSVPFPSKSFIPTRQIVLFTILHSAPHASFSSMSVGRNLVIFGIWATGMGAWAWWKYVRIDDSLSLPGIEAEPSSRRPPAPGVDVTWKWASESIWLVDQITRDIAEVSLYASNPKAGQDEFAG